MSSDTFKIDLDETKRPGLFVILAGLITTTMTMVILFYLNKTELQAMGFYLYAVIPVGAILVGLVAGSGYGIASYLTGAKIGKGLLLLVILIQVVAYFVAQYFEYIEALRRVRPQDQPTFLEFFDLVTRQFAFERNGKQPFGMWGYAMRGLEIAGFAGGGLIAPAVLRAVAYCEKCQVYRKSQELGLLPAGIKPRKIKKKDVAGKQQYEQEVEAAMDAGLQLLEDLQEAVDRNDPQAFRVVMEQHKSQQKEIGKLTGRLLLALQRCPRCQESQVVVSMATGQGEGIAKETVMTWDVDAIFTREIAAKK